MREFIPTDYRATMLILMHFWFTSGTMISALLDWGCGDRWRLMLFLATVPGFFLLLALYFSDEKPQFLLRMGKTDQVRKILRKMNLDEDKVMTSHSSWLKNIDKRILLPNFKTSIFSPGLGNKLNTRSRSL